MDAFSFAIHGTPGKSECWGMPDDDGYLKSFYDKANSATEQTRLDIDFRIVDNTVCSYYHYLKLNNISNSDARPGGYFGMSIRFEGAYCADVSSIYQLFDQLFELVVCKSLLKPSGTGMQYRFSSFKDCQTELENIEGKVKKNILEQFNDDIKRFSQNYSPKHNGEITQFNVSDTGSGYFQQVLFQDAEVFVSTEYPLLVEKSKILEKEKREQLELIKSQQKELFQKDGQISELNDTVANQGRTIKKQETEITNQSSEIKQQESAISNLQNDLSKANQTITKKEKTISEQIASINQQSDAISNLQKKLNQANQSISDLNKELRNKTIPEADVRKIDQCISVLYKYFDQENGLAGLLKTTTAKQTELGDSLNSVRQNLDTIQNGIIGYKKWLTENANKNQNDSNGGLGKRKRRDGRNSNNGDFGEKSNRNRKIIIPLLAFIVLLGGLGFLVFGDFQEGKHNDNPKPAKNELQTTKELQISELQNDLNTFKEETKKQFDIINQKISNTFGSLNNVSGNTKSTDSNISNKASVSENVVNSDSYKINIQNVRPPLTVLTEYTLQLLTKGDTPRVVDLGGQFDCSENAMITSNGGSKCTIKVLDNSKGPITVYYKKDDTIVVTREIEVR